MNQIGDTVDNYTLVRRLGINSYGEVWSARESITERLVRVNFLSAGDDYKITRFIRATSLWSRLNHPGIVAHTGHGYVKFLPYLATEHVQGPNLATLVANGGRMDELRVAYIARQIASALDHAWNTAEIVHRNLSPEAILVDLHQLTGDQPEIQIKINDFGHALGRRLVDIYDQEELRLEADFQRAAQAEIVGTPLTMSPEQVRGQKLTFATDMYALGATMYLLLTGKPPFSGTEDEIKAAHVRTAPLDLGQIVPGLQASTALLVRRLLAKSPDGRFPNWSAVAERAQASIDSLERLRRPREATSTAYRRTTNTDSAERVADPNDPGTGRKLTEKFAQTPQGKPLSGGIQGGGVLASETSPISDVESSARLSRQLQQIMHGVQMTNALVASMRPPSSGHRELGQQATTHPREGTIGGAPTPIANAVVPPVDDGLTPDQRALLWSFLFNNKAIRDATLSAAQSVTESHQRTDGDSSGKLSRPSTLVIPEASDRRGTTRISLPAVDQSPKADASLPSIEYLFDAGPTPVTAPPLILEPKENTFNPSEPSTAAIKNPAQSPWWKAGIEILRAAIIGNVIHVTENQSITRKLTSKLRRLVASREDKIAEIEMLIERGAFDEAGKRLDGLAAAAAAAGNDDQMCLLRARLAGMRKDYLASMQWAQAAVKQGSTNPLSLAIVGFIHLHARRIKSAEVIFDEAAQLHPNSALGPLGRAMILFLSGYAEQADWAIAEAENREDLPACLHFHALRCRAAQDHLGEFRNLRQLLSGTAADWKIQERMQELLQTNPELGKEEHDVLFY